VAAKAAASEVERVRGLLEQLEARQRTRPASERGGDARSAPRGGGHTASCADDARKGAGASAPACGSVAAWAEVPQRSGSSSFSAASRGCARILWSGLGPEAEPEGSWDVPRAVAKAFGSSARWFSGPAELERHLDRLTEDVLWQRVVALASARERSSHDLESKLRDEGFSADACVQALRRAERAGIVDDARYAESFVRSKVRSGWGRTKVEDALRRADVDPFVLEGYPGAYFAPDDEEERARALLARKPVPAKNPVEKLARHLVGKGFSVGLAFRLARERVERDGEA
jgi:regulatory protein